MPSMFSEAQLVLNVSLQVVNVTQPAVSIIGANVLQFVPETEKVGPAGVDVPGEVALQGLQFGLQC